MLAAQLHLHMWCITKTNKEHISRSRLISYRVLEASLESTPLPPDIASHSTWQQASNRSSRNKTSCKSKIKTGTGKGSNVLNYRLKHSFTGLPMPAPAKNWTNKLLHKSDRRNMYNFSTQTTLVK
jgi:hypothetical protein